MGKGMNHVRVAVFGKYFVLRAATPFSLKAWGASKPLVWLDSVQRLLKCEN